MFLSTIRSPTLADGLYATSLFNNLWHDRETVDCTVSVTASAQRLKRNAVSGRSNRSQFTAAPSPMPDRRDNVTGELGSGRHTHCDFELARLHLHRMHRFPQDDGNLSTGAPVRQPACDPGDGQGNAQSILDR